MSLTLVAITSRSTGRPMRCGDVAGEDVAEIAGRHREGDLAVRRAERDRGGEVVDDLRDDARPVDRVDARQPHPVAEGVVVEQALHDRLAVVERAFDRERVDVVVGRGRHHAAAARRRCGPAGTARTGRRARGRGTPRPPRRRCRRRSRTTMVVRSPRAASTWSISRASSCIATSLKASVGPWNSSSRKMLAPICDERRDGRMAEGAVGLARHAATGRPRRSRRRRTAGSPRRPPRHRAGRRSPRSSPASSCGQLSGT